MKTLLTIALLLTGCAAQRASVSAAVHETLHPTPKPPTVVTSMVDDKHFVSIWVPPTTPPNPIGGILSGVFDGLGLVVHIASGGAL